MQNVIDRMIAKQAEIRAKKDDEGFTLIELLVVVVIIGVLVAIAVPVYLNYRQGAADKSAQSDVRGAISAVEQYYTGNGNTYPTNAATSIVANSTPASSITLPAQTGGTAGTITVSDKTELTYVPPSGTSSYKICAKNTGGSGKVYLYDASVGGSVKTASGITPTATGC
ncbi:type IV pilin PilA [Actinoplanes sp. SE50]|uniref:prepilin-type N-terminal cleavage/methylation domain-containing protein n=1 Tax=unclassified Actinoplanes TaxID=2626549 RepID=UPI00023EC8EC|nr:MULTISPECIES: prepilin-type N-terminal cleavage/methylation domain-containing protein [unclassified Actinoplanes]AEV82023.1 Fimbrial protein [Actinoplanes sp. SE50/110]ATO80422.1 type IV pilin PilA [Actinoplanes sp. SE50]SLL97829.1 type IV pilin PilA [Actinoplanes sp. SE50/110]